VFWDADRFMIAGLVLLSRGACWRWLYLRER